MTTAEFYSPTGSPVRAPDPTATRGRRGCSGLASLTDRDLMPVGVAEHEVAHPPGVRRQRGGELHAGVPTAFVGGVDVGDVDVAGRDRRDRGTVRFGDRHRRVIDPEDREGRWVPR